MRALRVGLGPIGASNLNAGNAAYNKGDLDTAIADYTKAIELKPDDAEAYYNRGVAYGDKKLDDQAIADYTKAIELKPDDVDAVAYRGKKLYDQAIADYTKAIELKPDDATAAASRTRGWDSETRRSRTTPFSPP
jgi:tetratricopeptide (TPR) repeat protein